MYDFDIVESEPDSFDENDDPSVPLKKKGPGSKRRMSQTEKAYMQAGLDKPSAENHEAEQKVELSPEKAKLMAEEAKKAEKEILETEVGFWELVNCLGKSMSYTDILSLQTIFLTSKISTSSNLFTEENFCFTSILVLNPCGENDGEQFGKQVTYYLIIER